MAAGHVYLGGGTRVQKAVGVADTVEDMERYLIANTPEPDLDKIHLYCAESPAHFDWLAGEARAPDDGRVPDLGGERGGLALSRAGEAGAARAQGRAGGGGGRREDDGAPDRPRRAARRAHPDRVLGARARARGRPHRGGPLPPLRGG